jgi:uncharacterized membrane protein YeaQ/YmgE (transglycosylase-associated protein family)
MNVWELLLLLLVAAICGAISQAIVGFSRGGLLVAIAVGFIGALLGMWIQRSTGAPEIFVVQIGETAIPLIWTIIGGVLFSMIVSLLTPRYYRVRSSY